MNITEKAAYLKGLAEGIALDPAKPETKLINALIDCVNELALTIADMDEDLDTLEAYIEEIDEDLGDVEEYIFDEDDCDCDCCDDDCDCDCCCDDDYVEVECPACGEIICLDDSILDEDSILCPACGETLEFEFDCDCDCDED